MASFNYEFANILLHYQGGSSEMREMITKNRVEKLIGDRTGRPHYIKKIVEFR